jgi:hypothetical protein
MSHERFRTELAAQCAAAGIDLQAIPLARATREAIATREAEASCIYRHPHRGTECVPRDEPPGYRGLDDRAPLIVR